MSDLTIMMYHNKTFPGKDVARVSSETEPVEISVVMPCLNEAETLEDCIRRARSCLDEFNLNGEIIVADNCSSDDSAAIAEKSGVRVIHVGDKGYGSALRGGIMEARGTYIIIGDADGSYDFSAIMPFLTKLRQGYDLVMGNRFKGGIHPKAMPYLHRYIGNPALSVAGRFLFRAPCGDFYCGLRGFTRKAFERMRLKAAGMEFAYEMVIKAALLGMSIAEIPATLSPDGRSRPPHLKTFRDGLRTLRLIFMMKAVG